MCESLSGSVRVDETYVRIRGGVALPVPGHRQARRGGRLPAHRQARPRRREAVLPQDAEGRPPAGALTGSRTDGAGTYPGAIAAARKEGRLARDPVHHVTKHLQQGIESDHFRLKKNMPQRGHLPELQHGAAVHPGVRGHAVAARASASQAPGRSTSRTGCSGSASDFRRLTKRKDNAIQAQSATYSRARDKLGVERSYRDPVLGNRNRRRRYFKVLAGRRAACRA